MAYPVDGLPIDATWRGYDPLDWRNHPEPDGMDEDDDEDKPVSPDVLELLGFDPDEEFVGE